MSITCKRCGAPVGADDINLERIVAKCRKCNAVFDFSDQLDEAGAPARGAFADAGGLPVMRARGEVAMPEGWLVTREVGSSFAALGYRDGAGPARGDLTIHWRWFKAALHLPLLGFAVLWNVFLGFWYQAAWSVGNAPWIMFVFPLVHVGAGVAMGYAALAGLLNHTRVRLKDGVVEIDVGPVPWRGNHRLAGSEIKQLYCVEKKSRGKNGPRYSYEVRAQRRDDHDLGLVKGLTESTQALYLEQVLEQALGIIDVAVPGELSK